MARRHQRKPRRGVVLLIVLTLLTLLIVVGLTFAILSGQFRRQAEANARKDRYGDPANSLLERAMYQLVRDTNDARSVVRSHSLLRDMYGESLRGQQIGAADVVGGGQFMDFTANFAPSGLNDLASISQGMRTAGFLNGCVLTFVSGNLRNVSTRVAGYTMDVTQSPPQARFRVLLANRDDLNIATSLNLDQFVINGRAFAGTGAGYQGDPSASNYGRLARSVTIGGTSFPHTLLPNRVGEPPAMTYTQYTQGGLNEGYDAADYQNVALAAMIPDPSNPGQVEVLPSFHQVALINYWANHSSGMWDPTSPSCPEPNRYREFRRSIVFRPMPWDHPNFDGGNPSLEAGAWNAGPDGQPGIAGVDDDGVGGADDLSELGWPGSDDVLSNDVALTASLLNGSWDVDCDGDGTRDAVWLDLGFPIQTDASGRRYRPLFAILCTDLDGKLNLNAHGNLSHVASVPPGTQSVPLPVTLPTSPPGTVVSSELPRGQGYGPPEISLMPLFGSVAEYAALLQGNAALGLPGRYGLDGLPGDAGIQTLALLKMFDYPPPSPLASPTNYFLPTTPLAAFASPFDLRGEFAFGLDYRGMPLFERSMETNLLVNTAYETDLSANAPRGLTAAPVSDMHFSPAELERLLRAHDVDVASLPDRLWHLVDVFRTSPGARRGVTTDSYDPPSPGILPWPELLTEFANIGMDRPRHIVDILRTRLIAARSLTAADLDNPQVLARLNSDLSLLLSPEMVMGTRFDINRPFGNGVDNPSPVTGRPNQVVDDHGVGGGAFRGEEASNETVWGGIPFDHDNDGVVQPANDTDAFRARHLYAKHLYCLMMAIKPANLQIDFDGDPSNDGARETAYGIAQWAINVVDFRDSDSIMTPFEFDVVPFNDNFGQTNLSDYGWDVDGALGTSDDGHAERGLVWGCERPELLLSEAFAFHDRRTEDLDVGGGRTTSPTEPDDDFDQRLLPRGSFFVELYNPWAGDERAPGEFYYDDLTGNWSPGVMLNQVTPGSNVPVWRMVIAKGTNIDRDPDHWDPAQRMPIGAIERSIYFTPFAGPVSGAEIPYFTNLPVAPILPGRYAVVGSAGQSVDEAEDPLDLDGDGTRDYVTTIGRRSDAIEDGAGGLNYAGTRRIVLEPSLNLNEHQAQVLGNLAALPEPVPPDVQPSVGIVINLPSSLNVTEPIIGYPLTGPNGEVWDPTLADYEGAYNPALDTPLDTDAELVQNGTQDDYCVVHLQRLANPMLPYDPLANPYLTIDSLSSDLTSFNGVTADADPNAGGNVPRMTTRERGRSLAAAERRALWKHEPGVFEGAPPSPASVTETTPIHILDQVLGHTFGYLNAPYHPYYTAAAAATLAPPTAFPEPPLRNRTLPFYIGAPALDAVNPHPFPWLTWNNRPFVSQYELLMVSKSRSSRLPHEFDILPPAGTDYAPGSPGRFGHLLNFFQTSDTVPPAAPNGSNFYRLLELVHVPSRFVDTEQYVNPNVFTGTANAGTEYFHPPFNRISHYRDPGRINLNTIYDEGIWRAILAGHPNPGWPNFVSSRRGYGGASANILDPDSDVPSFFTNPFRPVGAGLLVPLSAGPNRLDRQEVETTLLRSTSIPYTANPSTPLLRNQSDNAYNHTDRNPYFRYQGIERLGNLVTTRSNVYAIWITMGYFEVEASPDAHTQIGLQTHPDGFRLSKELGSDVGTVKRHRAFFIVDRTKAAAFEPGENHNVDRTVLLRRFIE
ncbi:MAG: hypothetical protein ACYC6N_04810 [Pirellulaceae bacterium]